MAKVTIQDCAGILLALMERQIRTINKLEATNEYDWDRIKQAEAAYYALAEAADVILALKNAPVTHQDAPGSTQ